MNSIKITLPKGFKATEIIKEGMEEGIGKTLSNNLKK
jgi:hypothetical protein